MKDKYIEKVIATINTYQMIDRGDGVVCAVSGGADSTAMVVALNELRERYDLTLSVAHLNHMLRGDEAKRDQSFTGELAKGLGFDFYTDSIDVKDIAKEKKLSIQEAGRWARDSFFETVLDKTGGQKVATGHTATDNAETYLMRLIVGAGTEGLSGIPPVIPPYIRPLFDMTRAEVSSFLKMRGIDYVTDSSNRESKYLRNKIRNEVIPLLTSINPNVEGNLICAADEYRKIHESLKSMADDVIERSLSGDSLDIHELKRLPVEVISEVIKGIIYKKAKEVEIPIRLTRPHIDAVTSLISGELKGEKKIHLPARITVTRRDDTLTVSHDIDRVIRKGIFT